MPSRPATYKQEQQEYDYNVKLRAAITASRDVEQKVRATQLSQGGTSDPTDGRQRQRGGAHHPGADGRRS